MQRTHNSPEACSIHARSMFFKEKMKIVFDIGACQGESISQFDSYDLIYAFEPSSWSFSKLVENYEKDSRIKFYNMAISENDGEREMNFYDGYAYNSFHDIDYNSDFFEYLNIIDNGFDVLTGKNFVQTKRLDTFMNENCIDYVDFIKVDTQGHDLDVIKSLGTRISDVGLIEMEIQKIPLYKNSSSREESINFMSTQGFYLFREVSNSNQFSDYSNYEVRLVFKKMDQI